MRVGFDRLTNNAGGLEGGMTTGEPLVVRVAMKPITTLMTPLADGGPRRPGRRRPPQSERSDVTAVPAMGVIAEAMVAIVLADAMLEKFGGDSLGEMRRNYEGYVAALGAWRALDAPAPRHRHETGTSSSSDCPGCGQDHRRPAGGRARSACPSWTSTRVIVRRMQMPVARIFGEFGETRFRELEREAMADALAGRAVRPRARGWLGGATGQPRGREGAGGAIVYLKVLATTALARALEGTVAAAPGRRRGLARMHVPAARARSPTTRRPTSR